MLLSPLGLCVAHLGHRTYTQRLICAQRLILSTQHVLTKVMWFGHVLLEVVNLHTQPHTFSSLRLMVYPLSILTVSFLKLAWPVGKQKAKDLCLSTATLWRKGLALGSSDASSSKNGNNQMCPSWYGEGSRKCKCDFLSQFWLSCPRLGTLGVMPRTFD